MNLVTYGIFNPQRNTIYARVDSALHKIRETSEVSQLQRQLVKEKEEICSFLRRKLISCGCCCCFHVKQAVQNFASEYLKTPLGEPVKDKKNKTRTELWVEKFYKKTTTLPEPFPHELVERLEKYLDVS